MELFDAIYGRRSIRNFLDKKIESKKIKKIINAATYAPSACNIQGWKFIIVNKSKIKEKLIQTGTISFIKNAPIGILVLYDNRTENSEYKDYLESASAAIQNMLLAAYSLGLGTCWICHLSSKKVLMKIFNIPRHYEPIAYVAVGYPKKKPKSLSRKYNLNEIVSFNSFNFKEKIDAELKTDLIRFIRRIIFRLYKYLPFKNFFLPITKKFERFNEK